MKSKNIPADIKIKTIKEAQNEIKQTNLDKNGKISSKDLK